MTFKVPASKASIAQNQFAFEIEGKPFKIKKAKYLTGAEIEAMEAPGSTSQVYDLFGEKGTKVGDAVRGLDQEQFTALMEAWQEDSGLSAGESEASES